MSCFNPRAPCGARRCAPSAILRRARVSIHAPRVGRDMSNSVRSLRATSFNPRAPCGARPVPCCFTSCFSGFQSTRPVWGATMLWLGIPFSSVVSIHAPRVGRDLNCSFDTFTRISFNPRAPCGARRRRRSRKSRKNQSFNPRAPCGARPVNGCGLSDKSLFQSTRPVWGATLGARYGDCTRRVSIHAPRVGRDRAVLSGQSYTIGFNPRAPCGARPVILRDVAAGAGFNPRAPCGARPQLADTMIVDLQFQSTRPVWGATLAGLPIFDHAKFQSTRPVWGATSIAWLSLSGYAVSIHAPRVGRDGLQGGRSEYEGVSIHAPRVGRDVALVAAPPESVAVSIHAPRVGRDPL